VIARNEASYSVTDSGSWSQVVDSFTYQWLVDGAPVQDATDTTFLALIDYIGLPITCSVTAYSTDYGPDSATTNSNTIPYVDDPPVNTVAPSFYIVVDTPAELQPQAAYCDNTGTWSGNMTGFGYLYQWYADGIPVGGSTDTTWLPSPTATYYGKSIKIAVRTFNIFGVSDPTFSNELSWPLAPINTTAPSISLAGNIFTLDDPGSWAPAPTPTPTYTYQWLRSGTPIGGETSDTYTSVGEDEGLYISCRVTATNIAGDSLAAVSNALAAPSVPGSTVTAYEVTNNLISELDGASIASARRYLAPPINSPTWDTLTKTGTTLTGTGTVFLSELSVDDYVELNDDNGSYDVYRVTNVVSDTELTLDSVGSAQGTITQMTYKSSYDIQEVKIVKAVVRNALAQSPWAYGPQNLGTGDISCTANSMSVTGTGTAFESELVPGMWIASVGVYTNYTGWRQIASIESDTALTLTEGFDVDITGSMLLYGDMPQSTWKYRDTQSGLAWSDEDGLNGFALTGTANDWEVYGATILDEWARLTSGSTPVGNYTKYGVPTQSMDGRKMAVTVSEYVP
jgi:hypothetical protein